jgi:hypothetical protein
VCVCLCVSKRCGNDSFVVEIERCEKDPRASISKQQQAIGSINSLASRNK